MSTIKVSNLQNASAASPAIVLDANSRATLNGLSYPTEGSLSGRNRLLNADFRIDQRNAGASVTPTDGQYTVDRWKAQVSQASKFTAQQSTDAPTGFVNSLLFTSSSAYSVAAGDYFNISQYIEGVNVSDLGWGTANAKAVTLSFWVKCSLTGTFGGSVCNSANNRSYPFSYTVSAANTWEYKTVTISGDTTGTWATDNTSGPQIRWSLGTGSTRLGTAGAWSGSQLFSVTGETSLVGTNGATLRIAGCQFEAGSVATPFERRSYGQELMLAQRYYQTFGISHGGFSGRIMGTTQSTGVALFGFVFPVKMRATPTTTAYGNGSTTGNFNVNFPTTSSTRTPADFSNAGSGGGDGIAMNVSNTGVNNTACWLDVGVSGNQFSLAMSAEL